MGHSHFSTNDICISCEPDRPTWVLFSCKTTVNTSRKSWFEVCSESLCTVFNTERTHLWTKAYQCLSEIQALYSLYFSYMGCFYQLMVCSRVRGKTNKYTNIHTHTSENNFKKPGVCPQPAMLWVRAWFKQFTQRYIPLTLILLCKNLISNGHLTKTNSA